MMEVRIADKMLKMLLFVVFILCPIAFADAEVDTSTDDAVQQPNEEKCGSEEMYIYDAVNDRCMINFKKVIKRVVVVYGKNESIYIEGENLFRGIMISVILFMTCASVCVVSACIYCCRINYADRTLKSHVKALARKLKRDYKSKKMSPKRAPVPAIAESCTVVVEPAGVIVA